MSPRSLNEVERGIRSLLMDRSPTFIEGVSLRGQDAYRRLVRNGVVNNILRSCPIAHGRLKLAGHAEGLTPWVARFLEEEGPTTRLYRDVPMDFARWIGALAERYPDALPHPSLPELIAWEVLEVDVLLAPNAAAQVVKTRPQLDLALVFDPSLRLAAYRYPVHRLGKDAPAGTAPFPDEGGPWVIVAWRDSERFRWKTVSPVFGQLLAMAAQTGAALGELFSQLRGMGQRFDEGFIRGQLVDFGGRGALVGFAEPDDPDSTSCAAATLHENR